MTASDFGTFLVYFSTFEALLFIVLYHRLAAWWKSEAGRHVMSFMAIIAAVLVLSSLRALLGASLDTPWFQWLRVAVFVGVPVVIGWRIRLLIRAQMK